MGTWAVDSFDNDTALDWLDDLAESDDATQMLNEALLAPPDSANRACILVAAAEVLATLAGARAGDLPDALEALAESGRVRVTAELLAAATAALETLKQGGELHDLWKESGDFGEWQASVDALLARLRSIAKSGATGGARPHKKGRSSKKQPKPADPEVGQIYAVPIEDGSFGFAQIAHFVRHSPRATTYTAAFFPYRAASLEAIRAEAEAQPLERPLFVLTPSSDPIGDGSWLPLALRKSEYVNVDVLSKVSPPYCWFENTRHPWRWLLAMVHGLYPWDAFYDPRYLDKLLLPGHGRPSQIRFKADFSPEQLRELGIPAA